ncbi:MAG: hypothetical protein RL307_550, partial [Pseudomonadota bacterium]
MNRAAQGRGERAMEAPLRPLLGHLVQNFIDEAQAAAQHDDLGVVLVD